MATRLLHRRNTAQSRVSRAYWKSGRRETDSLTTPQAGQIGSDTNVRDRGGNMSSKQNGVRLINNKTKTRERPELPQSREVSLPPLPPVTCDQCGALVDALKALYVEKHMYGRYCSQSCISAAREEWRRHNRQCSVCGVWLPNVATRTVDGTSFCGLCHKLLEAGFAPADARDEVLTRYREARYEANARLRGVIHDDS